MSRIPGYARIRSGAPADLDIATELPELSWAAYFDQTYWEPDSGGHFTWDAGAWNTGNNINGYWSDDLLPIGSWASGFRPTQCKVTFTASGDITLTEITIRDSGGIIGTVVSSGVAFALSGWSGDITALHVYFEFDSEGSGTVETTNIEFYG